MGSGMVVLKRTFIKSFSWVHHERLEGVVKTLNNVVSQYIGTLG